MKCFIAVELRKNEVPRIIGVFRKKADAEKAAFAPGIEWGNVIESIVK